MARVKISPIETTIFHNSINKMVYEMEEKGFDVSYFHDGGKILRRHSIIVRGSDRDIAKLMLIITRMGYMRMSSDDIDESTRRVSTNDLIEIYKR